mmetsp:Transcript_21801/g.49591  ORF Transcript_21801/g.49591 Transcript_21801/m.49591 type:complete len:205 (+) Transcript_21801:849-1463(+)
MVRSASAAAARARSAAVAASSSARRSAASSSSSTSSSERKTSALRKAPSSFFFGARNRRPPSSCTTSKSSSASFGGSSSVGIASDQAGMAQRVPCTRCASSSPDLTYTWSPFRIFSSVDWSAVSSFRRRTSARHMICPTCRTSGSVTDVMVPASTPSPPTSVHSSFPTDISIAIASSRFSFSSITWHNILGVPRSDRAMATTPS